MEWRNDLNSKELPRANNYIECARDSNVAHSKSFSLNIIHVQLSNRRAFMPFVIFKLDNSEFEGGDYWVAYDEAVRQGEQMLVRMQEDLDQEIARLRQTHE